MRPSASAFAVLALATTALAIPHDSTHSTDMDMNMDMNMNMNMNMSSEHTATTHADGPMSYFAYGKHSSSIIAHIALMVLGWCFLLPAGMYLHQRIQVHSNSEVKVKIS
jgi:hypothetical protein